MSNLVPIYEKTLELVQAKFGPLRGAANGTPEQLEFGLALAALLLPDHTKAVLGQRVQQLEIKATLHGHLESGDQGAVFLSSKAGTYSSGELRYHTDRTDVVGLLTVGQADYDSAEQDYLEALSIYQKNLGDGYGTAPGAHVLDIVPHTPPMSIPPNPRQSYPNPLVPHALLVLLGLSEWH